MDLLRHWAEKKVLLTAVALGVIFPLLSIIISNNVAIDVANYYGPLAQEFAQGNYQHAFFHSIPPLVPMLAGVLAKTGMEALTALQIVSGVFFLAGLWPLYRILQRLVPPALVEWGCLLYIICPRLLRYVTMGILEGPKLFFILLLVERTLTYVEGRKTAVVWQMGGLLALLSLTRGEGIGYLPFFALYIVFAQLRNQEVSCFRRWGKAVGHIVLLTLTCLVICSPWIYYEYRTLGYPVLDSRQALFWVKVADELGLNTPDFPESSQVPREAYMPNTSPWELDWGDNISKTMEGFFIPFLIFVPFGIAIRRKDPQYSWNWIDYLFISLIVYNYLLFLGVAHVKKRYISTTLPFILPWTVLGMHWALIKVETYWRKWQALKGWQIRWRISHLIIVVFVVCCLWDGMSQLRSYLRYPHLDEEIGKWIRYNKNNLDFNDTPPLQAEKWGPVYHHGDRLVIATTIPGFAYFARADVALLFDFYVYPYEALVKFCYEKNVDILIAQEEFYRACPEFKSENQHFSLVVDRWQQQGILIYRFERSLYKIEE